MKKIFFVLLSAALMSNAVYSQKLSADKVPAVIVAAFAAKFPSATKVQWELETPSEYEANFKQNGDEVSANFDANGNWLETEIEITIAALPPSILQTLQKDFVGFKIKEASKIESAKNGLCYEAEIKKGKESFDVLFTPDGKQISKTKE